MNTLSDRLKRAFNPERHSQADLARAARVSPASVSDWFSGETKSLKADSAVLAARYLGVNAVWLVLGEGPAYPDTTQITDEATSPQITHAAEPPADYLAWPVAGLSMADVYQRLTPEQRLSVATTIVAHLLANAEGFSGKPTNAVNAALQSTSSAISVRDTPPPKVRGRIF